MPEKTESTMFRVRATARQLRASHCPDLHDLTIVDLYQKPFYVASGMQPTRTTASSEAS
jgi:hypothetical protein